MQSKIEKVPRDARIAKSWHSRQPWKKYRSQKEKHMQVQNGTGPDVRRERPLLSCATFVHPLQVLHGNLSSFGKRSRSVFMMSWCGKRYDQWRYHWIWPSFKMSFSIRERGTPYCLIRSPYRPQNFFNDDSKRNFTYPCSRSFYEGRVALKISHPYEEQGRACLNDICFLDGCKKSNTLPWC